MKTSFRWLIVTLVILAAAAVPAAAHPAAAPVAAAAGSTGLPGAGDGAGRSIFMPLTVAAAAATAPAGALGAGKVGGVVFFDSNGDGVRGGEDHGLPGILITLADSATLGGAYAATTTTDPDGAYTFVGLEDQLYSVAHGAEPDGYTSTTANPAAAQVSGEGAVTADFGVTLLLTLTGMVFQDNNGDGFRGLGEPATAGALVEIYRDLNSNGQRELTEPRAAYMISDSQGNYRFEGLAPGNWIVTVQLPGGAGATEKDVQLLSAQAGGIVRYMDIGVTPASAGGKVAGVVFFDSDGDGSRSPAEEGLPGVSVTLTGDAGALSATTAANGSYLFDGLAEGLYSAAHGAEAAGFISTTANPATVQVSGEASTTADFGLAVLLTLTGMVYQDSNGDGFRGLGELPSADALVEIYRDLNSNGQIDGAEPRQDYMFSDSQGNYQFNGLFPGDWVVAAQAPGGAGATRKPVRLISAQAGGIVRYMDLGIAPIGAAGRVLGALWNDRDGDELIEEGEPRFANATVYLYRDADADGTIGSSEMLAGKTLTGPDGSYTLEGLSAGAYVFDIDEGSLPGDFVLSMDAEVLAFMLADGEVRTTNLGYYDPLAVAPLRVADWKSELRQTGRVYYTAEQLRGFIAAAGTASALFPEGVTVEDALLRAAHSEEMRARKEHAALQLNMASRRLLPKTPVDLPDLTGAATVAAAVAEIEGLLWPPASQTEQAYRRAREIAHALNQNKGLGYGLDGVAAVEAATYRGASVVKKLAASGDTVDHYMDQPILLDRWGFKNLGPEVQVFEPKIRVGVKQFYNGGILEVVQVLPDGRELSLGLAVPARWNRDVNATFTFHLRDVPAVQDLITARLRLYVRDPDLDGGPKEHVQVDSVELVFRY